jgi:hypothetical protein
MRTLSAPSLDPNFDFGDGLLDGWKIESDLSSASTQPHVEVAPTVCLTLDPPATSTDYDLLLTTIDEGEQYIHHHFVPSAGVSRVKVRYRFQTDEIPESFWHTVQQLLKCPHQECQGRGVRRRSEREQ